MIRPSVRSTAVFRRRFCSFAVSALTLGLLASVPLHELRAGLLFAPPRFVPPAVGEPNAGELLTEYFETLLRDQDVEAFRLQVSTRYTEATLARLAETGTLKARQASVLALGLSGSYASNGALGRALRDDDQTVRQLAETALWSVWFRADTPENNELLKQVSDALAHEQLAKAITLATDLIERSPKFAEAYNRRAIAYFLEKNYDKSIADCQRVLELNPYHFGAVSGMAQCQLLAGKLRDALETYRRALKIQPHNEANRRAIAALEGMID